MSTPEAEKALSRAKVHLMSAKNTTFFSTLCCMLNHVWDNTIPTACTNGVEIRYNPQFYVSNDTMTRVAILLHEILHVACEHMLRLGDRKPGKANRAMDYAINLMIKDSGFEVPSSWLCDEQYRGMSWEAIYELLDDEPEDDKADDLVFGADLPGGNVKSQIDDMLVAAAQQSKMAGDEPGSIPAELERYIERLTTTRVPWHRILNGCFTKLAKVDYSFVRPNRRFFTQDIIMPSRSGHTLSKGAVITDVSGSIMQDQFNVFVSNTADMFERHKPKELRFVQFDTKIRADDTVTSLKALEALKFRGGGGTVIDPVMQWLEAEKPEWAVIFTDGYFSPPKLNPKGRIYWVIYDNPAFSVPFGKVVHFDLEKAMKQAA